MIAKNGLEIGNHGRATHHRTREGHEGELFINLTLANRPITKWSIVVNNHARGSNHEVEKWEVEVHRQE